MGDIAKIFMTGRSQAVRLPAQYRFDTTEVYIRRDPVTGDVILSPRPELGPGAGNRAPGT
jgi:antitoxin VapB